MNIGIERTITENVNVSHLLIVAPVNYDEEDIPADFPGRDGDWWTAKIDIDTGLIVGWPPSYLKGPFEFHMKVVDAGRYVVMTPLGDEAITVDDDYVPHRLLGESGGDYLHFTINPDGTVANWDAGRTVTAMLDATGDLDD